MSLPFPSSDPDTASPISPQPLATHLPFRRISLPPTPNVNFNRQSVTSLASFESISEHGASRSSIASPTKKSQSRRTALEARRKGVRKRGHRVPDEETEAKRRKVIEEFHETERTYVQGLDLIYEVSFPLNLALILSVHHLPPNSYFLHLSLLHLIPRNLFSTAQVSHPSFQISLTFGTSIVPYFLRLMNTFIPPLPLTRTHHHPRVLHHICLLFFCLIFRIYHYTRHLLPHSAHPWLP
jgi:hypothetical protein